MLTATELAATRALHAVFAQTDDLGVADPATLDHLLARARRRRRWSGRWRGAALGGACLVTAGLARALWERRTGQT
jgi:hypothetical protein